MAGATAACSQTDADVNQTLVQAEQSYRNRNYRDADTRLNALIEKNPNHPKSAEAYYLRALCKVNLSKREEARADVQRCLILSNDQQLLARAHATAGELAYEADKTRQATEHFAEALKIIPNAPQDDLIRYRYGLSLMREGQWKQARQQFATVFQRYPGAPTADHAKRMHEWPFDYFTVQCGAFRDRKSADAQVAKLKRVGLPAFVDSRTRAGETIQTVCVGHHVRYDQAKSTLPAVRKQVSDAHVVP